MAPQGFITVKLSPQWLHKHLGGAVPTMQIRLVWLRRSNEIRTSSLAGREAEGAIPARFRVHFVDRIHMHMCIRMSELLQCGTLSRLGKWQSSSTTAFSFGAVCLSASSSTTPLPILSLVSKTSKVLAQHPCQSSSLRCFGRRQPRPRRCTWAT